MFYKYQHLAKVVYINISLKVKSLILLLGLTLKLYYFIDNFTLTYYCFFLGKVHS